MSTTIQTPPQEKSPPVSELPAASVAGQQLAIYGGPAAVSLKYRERWKSVRIRDLAGLLPHVLRGRNTIVGGGPVGKLEQKFAALTDTRYAILMNSGTATLHSAFMAVGVGPGDEVIAPTYTWFATAAAALQCGAAPVFCDIDARTLTADPDDVEQRITERTKAICVVHVWGNPARLDRFVEIARRHQVALIEDASHAHGARYQGRPIGSWGDIGCFSLQGTKAVSGGEAGIVVTNNPLYFDRMLALGHNLREEDQVTDSLPVDQMSLGLKYRPHLCGAVLAEASLRRLPQLNALRKRNYDILTEELADCAAVETISTYDGAERGGYLEFPLRYRPEHAGGWPREAFVRAARAEGARMDVDRYATVSPTGQLLHNSPLFNSLDELAFGGPLRCVEMRGQPAEQTLPVAEQLAGELMSMRPFTRVREQFVREQARALRKVAEAAPKIRDFRTGR